MSEHLYADLHVRAQIRRKITQALRRIELVEGRVYSSRVYPMQELPAIGVYSIAETALEEGGTLGSASIQLRELALVVEARERAATTHYPDDRLDDVCKAIEPLMGADPTWEGLAHTTEYQQAEFIFDAETEQPAGVARLTWRIVYRVDVSDPTEPLP